MSSGKTVHRTMNHWYWSVGSDGDGDGRGEEWKKVYMLSAVMIVDCVVTFVVMSALWWFTLLLQRHTKRFKYSLEWHHSPSYIVIFAFIWTFSASIRCWQGQWRLDYWNLSWHRHHYSRPIAQVEDLFDRMGWGNINSPKRTWYYRTPTRSCQPKKWWSR